MSLGEQIRSLRKTAGLSQEALAEQLGVSRQAVSKWENDSGLPETEKLIRMSQIFDVSLDTLVQNDTPQPPVAHTPQSESDAPAPPLAESSPTVDPSAIDLATATGFLEYQSRKLQRIALAVMLLVGSLALVYSFSELIMLIWMLIDIIAVAQLILVYAAADPYRALRRQPLTLTADARTEIAGRLADEQPKLQRLLFTGIVLIGVGLLLAPLIVPATLPLADDFVLAGGMILTAAGVYLCIFTGGLLRTYRQLLDTEPNQQGK